MAKLTLKKPERLKSRKLLDELFESGKSFHVAPLKFFYKDTLEKSPPVQMGVSVPKRSFKRAVDRNKLKRRIREAYRKHKNLLYNALTKKQIALMIVYTAKEIKSYKEIEEKTILAIQRLIKANE